MFVVYFGVIVVAALIIWATVWITNKAYSQEWDKEDTL